MGCEVRRPFLKVKFIMEKKQLYIIIIVLAGLLAGSLLWNYKQYRDSEETKENVKIEYREKEVIVTVHDTVPAPADEQVIGQAVIPVSSNSLQSGKNDGENGMSGANGIDADTLNLTLPIVQRKYMNDSLYTAYVSGVKYEDYPRLDSINVKQKTVYQTTTITKEVQKKQKKFGVGVIGGYGYGFNSRQVEPYIGLGISYHLFEF